MNILGKKVVLRAIEERDLEQLHNWANDPEIWDSLTGWHFPSSMDFQKKWFTTLQSDSLNQRLAIETSTEGLIGTANLVNIDWKNNHATYGGLMLGEKELRGKGYGVDASMAIMRYAFDELHFERLDGLIIEYNAASIYVFMKKLGWKEEGRQRNWYFRKNRYWDKILIGITRNEYYDFLQKNPYW